MVVFYIVLAILLFGVLILVHEFGHFITAKLFGVQVNEFSLFMGPAIWKKQVGETLYSLRCIPIGGYCAMEGEDGESENPRAFTNAKVWKRLIILAAGSFMNVVIGLLICGIFTSIYFTDYIPGKQIESFRENCPYQAEELLHEGDVLYSIDSERVYVLNDFYILMDRNEEQVYDFVVLRDGHKVEINDFEFKPVDYNGETAYGINLKSEDKTVGTVLGYTWNQCIDFVRLVRMSFVDLFSGKASVKDMSGPVGIVSIVVDQGTSSETIGFGVLNVLYIFSLIAINLAVVNMLPVPALDGGRVVCLLVTAAAEKILRRKINPKYEGYLHGAFMVLLLLFMAFITVKDVFQFFGG